MRNNDRQRDTVSKNEWSSGGLSAGKAMMEMISRAGPVDEDNHETE